MVKFKPCTARMVRLSTLKSISRFSISKSGVGCVIYFLAFGSRASRTASPSSIKLSTVNARAPAGKNNTWRLLPERTWGWAAAISLPHDTTDGGRPIRKNDRGSESTRLNSSHVAISYDVFCLKQRQKHQLRNRPNNLLY